MSIALDCKWTFKVSTRNFRLIPPKQGEIEFKIEILKKAFSLENFFGVVAFFNELF